MTDQDMRDGKRLNGLQCPIALAVKRSMEKRSTDDKLSCIVMVLQSHIYIRDLNQDVPGSYYKPSVPQRNMISNFIDDFDQCLDVKKLPAFTIRRVKNVS